MWPRSYGLVEGQPEFSDLHNLRPADTNVNSSRGNKFFGDCTLSKVKSCMVPAHQEAAPDTATDFNSWTPPAQVRGDVARALLYMAVRYGSEQPSGILSLGLSDSPSMEKATMGLLSILLQWNDIDPPSDFELLRNTRICSLFQGNRNPFVDHPEFAAKIWQTPDSSSGNQLELFSSLKTESRFQSDGLQNPDSADYSKSQWSQDAETGPKFTRTEKQQSAWINELHYNNKGKDKKEFIEVVVGPDIDIASLKLVLYNGNGGKVYSTLPLIDPTIFKVCKLSGTEFTFFTATLPEGQIQNGPADGIALVQQQLDSSDMHVIQFLSYQGTLVAAEGPAKALVSQDIGVREGNSTPIEGSVGLTGIGPDKFEWVSFPRASPGALNAGQVIHSATK